MPMRGTPRSIFSRTIVVWQFGRRWRLWKKWFSDNKMGRKCIILGCLSRCTRLHIFPDCFADEFRHKAWVAFVQQRRGESWLGPPSSRTSICSEHFSPSSYVNGQLSRTAVPSIQPWRWEQDADKSTGTSSTAAECKLQDVRNKVMQQNII